MFKKKCPSCERKAERKFNYCPYCGNSFKKHREEEYFGMLGENDFIDESSLSQEENLNFRLPFGLDKMMNSLMKQLEKQMSELGEEDLKRQGIPRGFRIQISTGKPKIRETERTTRPQQIIAQVSSEEIEKRKKLPRVEAKSNLRRLGDVILYEIFVPGVKSKKDIIITKLENSIEIKSYSADKCYYKTIPLKLEIIGYYLKDEKLFLELKS